MRVVGLMSGTSADGIDAALYEIDGQPPQLTVQLIKAAGFPYDRAFREAILAACQPETGRVDGLCQLNMALGERFAQAVRDLLTPETRADLIGSHGQTVWHNVLESGQVDATLQLGAAAVIAERTGITTISDFRVRDVAAGGQGAPLTSYVDWLLLRHPQHWRAAQNIGGMGNVTFLPPLHDMQHRMLAFDTGPGNALIDSAVFVLTGGAQTYDADGRMAFAGKVDAAWLAALLDHPYYRRRPPRTTGRELFGTEAALQLVDAGESRRLAPEDIVATLTALTAHSIARAYRDFAPAEVAEVLLSGGGRHNSALVAMLRDLISPAVVRFHEEVGIDSDYKEAMVFAVLAYETWHNRIGCLPEQTGAAHGTVLGQITPGANFESLARRTWGNT